MDKGPWNDSGNCNAPNGEALLPQAVEVFVVLLDKVASNDIVRRRASTGWNTKLRLLGLHGPPWGHEPLFLCLIKFLFLGVIM